jgi:hypothetical protein
MKTRTLLIFIQIITGSIWLGGQEPDSSALQNKTYSFDIQFGINQIKEMNLLPLSHRGTLTEISFEIEKIKNTLRHFQFSLVYSRLKTGMEEMSKSGNIGIGLGYSFNFLVFKKNNLRYYLGPQALLSYSYMLYPNWDDSHGYWADYLSFGASNILSFSLKHENEWFTSLNFGLVSFFSRPEETRPYKMDDSSLGGILKALNSNIELGSINNALQLNLKTEYRFPVFQTKREAITYNMDIVRFSQKDEHPVIQIIYSIGIKIML